MNKLAKSLLFLTLAVINFSVNAENPPIQISQPTTSVNRNPQLPAIHQQSIVIGGLANLDSFPEILCHPHAVRVIHMTNNALKTIPPCISNHALTLKELVLSSNKIDHLPNEIGSLMLIETLSLDNNELSSIPYSIGQLSSLTSLRLSNNKLSSLPAQIGNLRNLRTLDLRNNDLSSLPFEISKLTNLNQLWLSDDSDNKLLTAPEFLPYLINLTRLVMRSTPPLPLDQQEAIKAVFKDKKNVTIDF